MKNWYVLIVSCGVFLLGLGAHTLFAPHISTLQAEKCVPLTSQALLDTETTPFCQIHADGSITRGLKCRTQTCLEWRQTFAAYSVSEWSRSGVGSIADRWLCYVLDPVCQKEPIP